MKEDKLSIHGHLVEKILLNAYQWNTADPLYTSFGLYQTTRWSVTVSVQY